MDTRSAAADELNRCLDSLKHSMLPTFIIDPFSDIVAVNWMTLDLLGITSQMLEVTITEPFSTNLMYYVLSPISGFYELIGMEENAYTSDAAKTIIMNMQIFQRTSLCYRHHPYYRSVRYTVGDTTTTSVSGAGSANTGPNPLWL